MQQNHDIIYNFRSPLNPVGRVQRSRKVKGQCSFLTSTEEWISHDRVLSLTQLSSKWVTTVPGLTPLTSSMNTTRLSSWRYLYGGHCHFVAGSKGPSQFVSLEGTSLVEVGGALSGASFGGSLTEQVEGQGGCAEKTDRVGA